MKRKVAKVDEFKNKRVKQDENSVGENNGLPSETRTYLLQLNKDARKGVLEEVPDQKEEISNLSERVAEEIAGHVLAACDDPPVSRLLEYLLNHTGASWTPLCVALSDSSAGLTTRRNWGSCGPASRVLEALINTAGRIQDNSSDKEARKALKKIVQFLFNNFDLENGALEDKYNHLVRACLISARNIYPEICTEFCKRCLDWPQIYDHCEKPSVSALLQDIVMTLEIISSELCESIVEKIFEEIFSKKKKDTDEFVFDLKTSRKPIIMLLECLIVHGPANIRNEIFKNHLQGRLLDLCLLGQSKTTSLNFLVMKLLNSIKKGDDDMFRTMFSELTEDGRLKKLLDARKFEIISALSKACLDRGKLQGEFAKAFREALGFPGNRDYIKQALFMNTDRSHVPGSEILQNQLKFKKPVKTVDCFLGLPSSELLELALEPKGSRLFDAFMRSSSVGEKSREKLANRLVGSYLELAKAKFGSRVFDAVWDASKEKMRIKMLEELDNSLKGTPFGFRVAKKIMLDEYKKDAQAWRKKNSSRTTNKKNVSK